MYINIYIYIYIYGPMGPWDLWDLCMVPKDHGTMLGGLRPPNSPASWVASPPRPPETYEGAPPPQTAPKKSQPPSEGEFVAPSGA